MGLPLIHPDLPIDAAARPEGSLCARALVQRVRWGTGLTQEAFARTFRLDVEALTEIEAGRALPDATLLAYLQVIEWRPEAVLDALDQPTTPI
jgi:DNA-binding transcriptional regulator YiaG